MKRAPSDKLSNAISTKIKKGRNKKKKGKSGKRPRKIEYLILINFRIYFYTTNRWLPMYTRVPSIGV